MTLPTPDEVRQRWPIDDYPPDTLGGIRRDIILEAHELIEELRRRLSDHPEVAEALISGFVTDLLDDEQRIDELQAQGLRTGFRQLMGYDIPEEDR